MSKDPQAPPPPSNEDVKGIQKALAEKYNLKEGEHFCPETWPCPICEDAEEEEDDES